MRQILKSVAPCRRHLLMAVVGVLALSQQVVGAQEAPFKTQGSELRDFASKLVEAAAKSTVRIYSGRSRRSLGAIVRADGWILTKASELGSSLSCSLPNGEDYDARIVAQLEAQDLALLKIDAVGLTPLGWAPAAELRLGQFVLAPAGSGMNTRFRSSGPGVGVVSVRNRLIPAQPGLLGVLIDRQTNNGVVIDLVHKDSGAYEAGLLKKDRILFIGEEQVRSFEGLTEILSRTRAGSTVKVTYLRDAREDVTAVTLRQKDEANNEDWFSGRLSRIRSGFPSAFQHDTPISKRDCGGPVINLMGRVVGINIARVTRTSTYALPAKDVQVAIRELFKLAEEAGAYTPSKGDARTPR